VAALRDPYQRLLAELWARHAPPVRAAVAPETAAGGEARAPAPALSRRDLGWSP